MIFGEARKISPKRKPLLAANFLGSTFASLGGRALQNQHGPLDSRHRYQAHARPPKKWDENRHGYMGRWCGNGSCEKKNIFASAPPSPVPLPVLSDTAFCLLGYVFAQRSFGWIPMRPKKAFGCTEPVLTYAKWIKVC